MKVDINLNSEVKYRYVKFLLKYSNEVFVLRYITTLVRSLLHIQISALNDLQPISLHRITWENSTPYLVGPKYIFIFLKLLFHVSPPYIIVFNTDICAFT